MKIVLFHTYTKKKLLLVSFVTLLFVFSLLGLLPFLPSSINVSTNASSLKSNNLQEKFNSIINGTDKTCYLTFDDGPNPSVTPKVLDILKEEDVKATFFVIGKHVDAHPEIVKRAYDEGHYIANHGYSHNNSVLYKNFESEIRKTDLAIGKAIGIPNYCANIFRFPNRAYGSYL